MDLDKICLIGIACIIAFAVGILGLLEFQRQEAITNAVDPVATSCALANPRTVSALCLAHERQFYLPSAHSLQPLQD